MKYDDLSKDDLIELLEERDQSIEDLTDEIKIDASDARDYDNAIKDLSTIAEKSFYAGLEASRQLTVTPIKAWLNYKIGERL